MSRPKVYPTFYCSHCQEALKRLKDIYHDCVECGRHYKIVNGGELVEIERRKYELRDKVRWGEGKEMTADEFESLVG